MKGTLAFVTLIFVGCSTIGFSQQYYVLQVKGKVKEAKTKRELKTNDVLNADDKVVFSSDQDAVALVSSKSGRFVLKPGAPTKSHELVSIVKEALIPGKNKLSTRSGERFKNVIDIRTYFSEPVLLIRTNTYHVDTSQFRLTDKSFFFIRYTYQGSDINKKLQGADDSFIVDREELYRVDGNLIDESQVSNLDLYYMSDGKFQKLTNVTFALPDRANLKQEIVVLTKSMDASDQSKVNAEIKSYLQEFYGRVDEEDLNGWLKGH